MIEEGGSRGISAWPKNYKIFGRVGCEPGVKKRMLLISYLKSGDGTKGSADYRDSLQLLPMWMALPEAISRKMTPIEYTSAS